ncbi:hypothetical protein PaG_04590 [Moesziomyces aphidis]|uniref:Myp1 protein n=1 Tax=Moesziomyces aphidis TaxID=84754 RepID=W3VGJ0_MOEAP|nr:hypothetical protein PaG_04590 [Moesziomyces aphidis]
MSQQDGTPFAHHSLLSPPLLAAIDSQHVFGPYDSTQTPREPSQLESSSRPTHRRTRSRASSVASVHSLTTTNTNATTSQSSSQRRARRSHNVPGTHGRSGSNSISSTASGRAATLTALSPTDASRPLMASSRNRSIPNLDGLHSLSAAHEHGHAARPSAYTAPSSPLLSAAASLAFAMSPVAHASAMTEHVVPSDWALDASVPSTPHTALSRNASDYFDPALLAHLQSHDPSSHPELCASQPVPSPPPAHSAHAARSASQSEWAQHAAHMQQTAQLLGLQRLFASRSTPHLPDLDSSYLGHDFDSPPPYAPRAAAHETELERAADVDSSATSTPSRDPPLPPPISIPAGTPSRPASGPSSATVPARPPLSRARSSSRGSRSGPPSPSASFYGRRGLTSLSPFPAGLEMTPSVMHVAQFASTPTSPGFAPDSDGDEDLEGALSFSSSRSKQRRDERTISANADDGARSEANGHVSASLPASSSMSNAGLTRRRRAGSTGSARQLLRPRTPSSAAATRGPASTQQAATSSPAPSAADEPPLTAEAARGEPLAPVTAASVSSIDVSLDADSVSQPVSPTSDSTRPDSPSSPEAARHTHRAKSVWTSNGGSEAFPSPGGAAAEPGEDEEFPLVLQLLLHPLRILAAVPGCIGTFWLARNAYILASRDGQMLSPGPMLVLADGTQRFWSADLVQHAVRLGRRQPGALDFAVACLWSMSTAYHALSFTTLLLRRWLLYYSILPSLIRLMALQAICWPLVRLTVYVFGADQPLGAWVVIGTTTALSDVVSRWVTSNIADAPLDDEVDDEHEDEALGYLSDYGRSPTRAVAERMAMADSNPLVAAGGAALGGASDWDPRSGDESDAAAASFIASERERQRKQRRGGQGTRFWRAVIGGPSFAAPSRRKARRAEQTRSNGAATETEVEAESDWPGYATDRTVLGAEGLRRRIPAGAGRRTVLPPFPFRPSTYRQGSTRYAYSDGAWTRERTSSRRIFHWDVAVWRNVVPIAALAYLSMWILVCDAMRLGG